MKKRMALLLALVMLFSMIIIFAGCEGVTPKTATSPQQDDDYELEDEEEEEQQGDSVTNALQLAKQGYEDYMAIAYEGDASRLDQLAPLAVWQYHGIESADSVKEVLPAAITRYIEKLSETYGDNVQVSYKIKRFDAIENYRFLGITEALEQKYGLDPSLVQNGIQLMVDQTMSSDTSNNTQNTYVFMICYDGCWYYITGGSRTQDDGTYIHNYQFAADYVINNILTYLDEKGQTPGQEQETPVVTDP